MSPLRTVTMPVKVRVDATSINNGGTAVVDAVDAAGARAVANAGRVLADAGWTRNVYIHAPRLTWVGNGLDELDWERQLMIDQRIADKLKANALALGTIHQPRTKPKVAPKLLKPAAGKAEPKLPPEFHDPPELRELEVAEDLPPLPKPPDTYDVALFINLLTRPNGLTRSRAFLALLPYLELGDEAAFGLTILYAVRPDNKQPSSAALYALQQLARKRPGQFKRLLRELLLVVSPSRRFTVERTEQDIWISDISLIKSIAEMSQVVHVAESVPEAHGLLQELERSAAGTQRLIGLLEAVLQARRDLIEYLLSAPRSSVMASAIREKQKAVSAYEGLFALFAIFGGSGLDVYELEGDLTANADWIGVTLARAREIDSVIDQYRRYLGDAAYDTDEVQVLQGVRNAYLTRVVFNLLPTRGRIEQMLGEADAGLASWRDQAVARKLPRLLKGLEELKKHAEFIGETPKHVSTWSYRNALSETMHSVYDTEKEIYDVDLQMPNIDLLQTAAKAEHDVAVTGVRVALLILWWQALNLSEAMDYVEGGDDEKQVGSDSDREDWTQKLERTIAEVKANYDHPDYKNLAANIKKWQADIESVGTGIQDWRKSQIKKKLLIGLVAIIVTGGVGLVLEAAEVPVVIIVLAEAGTFTLVETGLDVAALGEDVRIEDVGREFAEQLVFFGAGRVLSKLGALTIEALGAERALLKISVILGEAALQASVPPAMQALETREWPESTRTMFGAGFLLNVVVAGITKRGIIRDARLQTSLLRELENLERDRQQWLAQMEEIAARGGPSEQEFLRAQRQGVAISEDIENALNRMRALSDDGLSALRLTRDGVDTLADMSRSFRDQIEASQYAAVRGLKRLPPPPESVVSSGLVRRSAFAFEYNPNAPGRSTEELVAQFRRAGYEVTDRGGVLFLEGPAGTPPYRLLPGAPDVAPALRITGRVAKAGEKLLAQDPEIMAQLTRVAQAGGEGEKIATRIARSVGRLSRAGILGPQHTTELRGLLRFLSRGGDPETLARLLSPRDLHDADMRVLMRLLNHLDEDGVKGVKVLFDLGLNPARVNDAIQNLGRESPQILNGALGALSDIAPRSRGLQRIMHFLYGNNPRNYRALQGVLFSAVEEMRANPNAILVFEEPLVDVLQGRVVRFTDIQLTLPSGRPLLRVEVKEIASAVTLGDVKVLRQLANDVAEDFRLRTTPPSAYGGGSRGLPFELEGDLPKITQIPASSTQPFQTLKWRIRYFDIATRLTKRMKIDDIYDARVIDGVKTLVRGELREALTRPELSSILKAIPEDELVRYRQALERLDFVELF